MDSGDPVMVPVFVNERPLSVPAGTTAGEAARRFDPEIGIALEADRAYLTDGRGIRVDARTPLTAGAILRIVKSARRGAEPADA